ncbi:MAG TPA: hypothetical protein VJ063_01515 [Verrucomicrobiae bacterium]|nr:hypothetical protein [Verrucomicrobiae bacterium]
MGSEKKRENNIPYPVTIAHDFKEFLSVQNGKGEPAIVVGGHAASLWALHYAGQEPAILNYAPYTSKDMDFVGDRTTALTLARMVNQPAERAPRNEPTPVIYRIKRLFPDQTRQNSTLEVLDHLAGVTNNELRETAVTIYSKELDMRVRLPSPITCLKSATRNLMRLQQEKRDDLKKVRILIFCCRAYLREQVKLAEAGKITEGAVASPFETLLRWMGKRTAQKAATDHKIDWREAFPMGELENTFIPRLRQVLRCLKPAPSTNGHAAKPHLV